MISGGSRQGVQPRSLPFSLSGVRVLSKASALPALLRPRLFAMLEGTDAPGGPQGQTRRTPRSNDSLTALFTSVTASFTLEPLRIFLFQIG